MTDARTDHPIEQLSAWLDGEITDPERAALEAHVAACAVCAAVVDDFRRMAVAAAGEAPPPVPDDLAARIRSKIAGVAPVAAPRRPSRLPTLRFAAAAAAVVLAIGLWSTRRILPPQGGRPVVEPSAPVQAEADRGKIEPGAASLPPPPPPPAMVDSLRSLGYVGGESAQGTSATPAPAAGSKTRAAQPMDKREARPAPARDEEALEERTDGARQGMAAGVPAAPAASSGAVASGPPGAAFEGTLKDDAAQQRKEEGRDQAATSGLLRKQASAASVDVLQFDYPDHRFVVRGNGEVALTAGDYACSVRRDGALVDPDIEALFDMARTSGGRSVLPETGPGGAAVVRLLRASAAAETERSAPLPDGASRALESRLRALLSSRYLALMERRCGSPPREARPAP